MSQPAQTLPLDSRVTFPMVFEGLVIRGYAHRLTPLIIERLRAEGLDIERRLLPGYPTRVWYQAVRILAEEVHPDLSYEQGVRETGRAFIRGYFETALGRTVLAVLRLLGPLRSLKRMGRNFRTGNNFSETWVHEDGPGNVRLEVNDPIADSPTFIQGLIEGGMGYVQAKDVQVEVESLLPNGHVVYRVRWRA